MTSPTSAPTVSAICPPSQASSSIPPHPPHANADVVCGWPQDRQHQQRPRGKPNLLAGALVSGDVALVVMSAEQVAKRTGFRPRDVWRSVARASRARSRPSAGYCGRDAGAAARFVAGVPAQGTAVIDGTVEHEGRRTLGFEPCRFTRMGAVSAMRFEDVHVQNRRTQVRPKRKGGTQHESPCHHGMDDHLHACVEQAGLERERSSRLFQTVAWHTGALTRLGMTQSDLC